MSIAPVIAYFLAHWIELLGFLFTIISIWLNTKQNAWGWWAGIISIACYTYVFASVWLIGDFLLNIYFLLMSVYGWYAWQRGRKENDLPISLLSAKERWRWLAVGGGASIVLGGLLNMHPQAAVPYWDAETTAFSLIGQWLLARKKLENWWVWLFVNVQYVVMYFYKELFITSFLYFILLFLAFKGHREWAKAMGTK